MVIFHSYVKLPEGTIWIPEVQISDSAEIRIQDSSDSRGFAHDPCLSKKNTSLPKSLLRNPPIRWCWTRRIQEVQSLCRAAKCREQLGSPSWLGRLQKPLGVKNCRIARSPQHSYSWLKFIEIQSYVAKVYSVKT